MPLPTRRALALTCATAIASTLSAYAATPASRNSVAVQASPDFLLPPPSP